MVTLMKVMSCNIINKTLIEIKNQLGLKLKLYDGVLKSFKGYKYFDIELENSPWCSKDFDKLYNYSKKYNTFKIEQTGYKRIGVFLNK